MKPPVGWTIGKSEFGKGVQRIGPALFMNKIATEEDMRRAEEWFQQNFNVELGLSKPHQTE